MERRQTSALRPIFDKHATETWFTFHNDGVVYTKEQTGEHTAKYKVICRDCSCDDARLIAAAPELLEALEGLLDDISEYQHINNLGDENNHSQIIARAAIAKARGQA